MEAVNIKLVLFLILAVTIVLLAIILIFQRKRKVKIHRSTYIDALYALIENRKDDALRLLTDAVKKGEGDIDAYLQLGNLLREKNQAEKALQIHKGLTVRRDLGYEDDKTIQLAIAEDLASLGKIDRAIQVLEKLYARKKDPEVVLSLHTLYHRNKNYDRAFHMLKDMSRLGGEKKASDRASYLATVSDVLRRGGRTSMAKKYLERARKENKNSTAALYVSGLLAMEEDDMRGAAMMWEKLLNLDIEYFADVMPLLEKVLYESGRFHDLEMVLNDLLQKYPSMIPILVSLATLYEKKGDLERAVGVLESELAAVTRDPVASVKLANLYLHAERLADAVRYLDEIDLNSKKPVSYLCQRCGNRTAVPLAYCDHCSGFNTFVKSHEKIPV